MAYDRDNSRRQEHHGKCNAALLHDRMARVNAILRQRGVPRHQNDLDRVEPQLTSCRQLVFRLPPRNAEHPRHRGRLAPGRRALSRCSLLKGHRPLGEGFAFDRGSVPTNPRLAHSQDVGGLAGGVLVHCQCPRRARPAGGASGAERDQAGGLSRRLHACPADEHRGARGQRRGAIASAVKCEVHVHGPLLLPRMNHHKRQVPDDLVVLQSADRECPKGPVAFDVQPDALDARRHAP
mmetsp:Transcript_4950/g.14488  ORF Transcript_4950/g.14488 Transcript_4950/m.14488 type:complete len:237 (-) Transcript_4950:602-1312(-)